MFGALCVTLLSLVCILEMGVCISIKGGACIRGTNRRIKAWLELDPLVRPHRVCEHSHDTPAIPIYHRQVQRQHEGLPSERLRSPHNVGQT